MHKKNLHSFILTHLDDGSHHEFYHVGLSHLSFSSQTHSHLPALVPTICTKKTWLPLPSPPFAQKVLHSFILTQLDDGSHLEFYHVGLKNFTPSFWLNLMMAAILNSAMLDSDTLFSSLRFTQKHSHSTLTLTQTNLIWLKLIHSHSNWWWQPSWILPSWIQPFSTKLWLKLIQSDSNSFILTQLDDGTHLEFYHVGFSHCHLGFSHLAQNSDSNSFILTQIDDGSHLEFCHLGFSHLSFSSQIHSHLPRLVPTICTKKPSLIHSDSTWWWQPSWILPCWIQTLPSWIQTPFYLLSDSLKNTLPPIWIKLIQSDSNSFFLT